MQQFIPRHLVILLAVVGLTACNEADFGGSASRSKDKDKGGTDTGDAAGDAGDGGPDGGVADAGTDGVDSADAGAEGGGIDAADGTADAGIDGTDSDSETYNEGDIGSTDDIAKLCAKKTGKQLKETIEFAQNNAPCPWGSNDNGAQAQAQLTARIEQDVKMSMPAKSVICDVDFAFPSQDMQYDDHIFLMLDKYILAASKLTTGHFTTEGDLMVYDWAKIKGMTFTNSNDTAVCLGGAEATCSIPATETQGKIELKIPDSKIKELSVKLKDASDYKFKFVTTGDNDADKDCKHLPVKFDITVKYLKLKP